VPTEAFDNRELVGLVLRAADQVSSTNAAEVIQHLVAEPPGGIAGPTGELLLDFVVGARALRDWLAALEVEAGVQARDAGVTVRQVSAATGIAERNVRLRYRRGPSGTRGASEKG
jgi:hypothetical protein